MSTHRNFDKICVAVTALMLLITVLFMNGSALGIETIIDEDAENHAHSVYFTANDLNGEWSTDGAAVIRLNGSSARITGKGAYFYNGDLVISGGGKYLLSGTLTDGSIIVDAYKSSKVWLLFDGVDIACSDDACLRIDKADKVFLTLAEGSENSMVSGAAYSEEALEDNTGGVIFSHDDLTINGSGSLTLEGAYKHGIDVNDELVITGGKLTITAAQDAIHVSDGICIGGGELVITAGDDGIHSDTSAYIENGSILILSCYEGIEALTVDIAGGDILIYAEDDGINANGRKEGAFGMGGRPGMRQKEQNAAAEGEEDEETWLHISGGSLTVINGTGNDADGIDSNGDILITGGSVRISLVNNGSNSALDYGSESGGTCIISGGDVVACGSYAMAEGFESESEQCSVLYNLKDGMNAGTEIVLKDAEENILLSYEAPCSFSSVVLSCPEMQLGETYLLVIGDSEEEITLEEIAAAYGDAQSSMFFGNMNWGGMQRPRGDGFMHGRHEGEEAARADDMQPPEPPEGEAFDGTMPQPPEMPDGEAFDGAMPQMPAPPGMDGISWELPADP